MARKFLYLVAGLALIAIFGAIAINIWSKQIAELALIPSNRYVAQAPLEANAYQDPAMWFSRPGIGVEDPARWQPAFDQARSLPATSAETPPETAPPFAVFFIHPTSYLDKAHWNAPLDDADSQNLARLYLRGMASPFNKASEIWAPRYRQATFGAFLDNSEDAAQAIDAAYGDVRQAWEFFLASVDPKTPIVIAGHSQGSLHLLRLLREEIAGKPVAKRIAAIYAVGWPVSVEHDLPALGFPACATPGQPRCIMSWSSFAEPADPSLVLDSYRASKGFDGQPRGESRILCSNPLTGSIDGEAKAERNLGTLVPTADLSSGALLRGAVPARCDKRGLLLIGDPPNMGPAVLPGNNYHVYDIPLFWANLQQDVVARVTTWTATR